MVETYLKNLHSCFWYILIIMLLFFSCSVPVLNDVTQHSGRNDYLHMLLNVLIHNY